MKYKVTAKEMAKLIKQLEVTQNPPPGELWPPNPKVFRWKNIDIHIFKVPDNFLYSYLYRKI